jgi:PTS system mannose-specific IIB component/fructoselysine and glucoselysine-specific PTS system IIB component
LRADRYLVIDDELAKSPWEQELYRLGAGDANALFSTVENARAHLSEWRDATERSILLTRDVGSMLRLARGDRLRGEKVNLGGQHHGPGRDEVLSYLHLTADDRNALVALDEEEGVNVFARDLPDSHKVPLRSLLGG